MRLHSTSGFVGLVHEEVEGEQPAAKKTMECSEV